MQRKAKGKQFMLGMMIGSTVGAISAILCKTKRGHQIHKTVAAKYHKVGRYLKGALHKHKSRVAHAIKKITHKRSTTR